MFPTKVLILSLALTANSFLPTLSDDDVEKLCTEGALKYKEGKSYVYEYSSKWDRQDTATLEIKGDVVLTPLKNCQFILTLEDSILKSGVDENLKENGKITKSSLKFTMYNTISDVLVEEVPEDPLSGNVKRGILSMIKNRAFFSGDEDEGEIIPVLEESIFGFCMTNSLKSSTDVYNKEIDLTQCDGEDSDIISQGVDYYKEGVVNSNIMSHKKLLSCEQTLKEGIISEVRCTEDMDTPFEMPDINLVSELVYKSTTDRKFTDEDAEKFDIVSTIQYNFTKTFSPAMEKNAIEKVKALLSSLSNDRANRAEVFMDLKRAMLKITDLKQFNDPSILLEEIHAKIFYDAAAEISTDGAVELLSELASKGTLDTTTLINFYTNMAFAAKPGRKAMNALRNLVSKISIEKADHQDRKLKKEYETNVSLSQLLLLGSSGLGHQFCKNSYEICEDIPEYNSLVNAIAQYAKVDTQEDILRGALYALGNLDHLTDEAAAAIKAIMIGDTSTTDSMRIIALEAFRRDGSQADLCKVSADILGKQLKTDDLRIQAYLAITRCENITAQEGLEELFSTILQDESSGVGAFIVSHVRGLNNSASPSEEKYRIMVENNIGKFVSNKLSPPTYVRSSRYMENSYFDEKMNLGYSMESRVIFMKGDINPQFGSLKATVDLFGTSFNFLEIGLSRRLMMSTKMFYPDNAPPNWWSLMGAMSSPDSYYRVFGTTIGLGLDKLHEAIQMSIKKGEGSAGTIIETIIPKTFLDEELTYPTITGLPLTYNLQGMHLESMKYELIGMGDKLTNFNFNAPEFDIKIRLKLDSATAFKGFVSVGANTPIHVGRQVEGMVDHQQNMELEGIKKDNGNQYEFRINLPETVISRKSVKAEKFTFEDLNGVITKANRSHRASRDSGTGKITTKFESPLLGLSFYNGFTGIQMNDGEPFELETTVEKLDTKMTGYAIQFNKKKNPKEPFGYEIMVTTPGSDIKRNLTVKIEYGRGGSEDKTDRVSTDVKIQGKVDDDEYFVHSKIITKPRYGACWYGDYSIITEYSAPGNADPTQLINITTNQNESYDDSEDNLKCELTARFAEPLKSILGDIDFSRTRRRVQNGTAHDRFETHALEVNNAVVFSDLFSDSEEKRRFSIVQRVDGFSRMIENDCGKDHMPGCRRLILDELSYAAKYSEKEGVRYELGASFNTNRETVYKTNLSANFKDANAPTKRFQFTIETLKNIHESRNILSASPKLDVSIYDGDMCIFDTMVGYSDSSLAAQTSIPKFVEFNVNATMKKGYHTHFSIEYKPEEITLTADADINDDGNQYDEKVKATLEYKKQDKLYTFESETLMDRKQRTLTVASKTSEKEQVLSKFDLSAKLAQDLLNGKSTAVMTITDEKGDVYRGSMNETMANKDSMLNSQFALEFEDVKSKDLQKPLHFTWDLVVDSELKHPDLYDSESHISSDKKLTAMNIDFEIVKEISWTKTKGKEVYHMDSSTNVTSDKKMIQQSEMTMDLTGNPTTESGKITVSGFSKDATFKNDFSGTILCAGKPSIGSSSNMTFTVDQTNLESGSVENLIEGSINQTSRYSSMEDFEFHEIGRVTLKCDKTYNWAHMMKYHNGDFIYQ